MKQAMFYQAVLGLDNQAKYIYDKDSLHLDKLAVFSLKNEWCKNTGKEVIGEFVENENIQQVMEKIGIAHSQGYYFAKPERWEDIEGKISCV